MPKRPRPRPPICGIRARVVRGPDDTGRWYWRCWRTSGGAEKTLATGWWTPDEVERVQAGLAVDPEAGDRERARTLYDLLDYWIASVDARADLAERTKTLRRYHARKLVGTKETRTDLGRTLTATLDRRTLERYRDRQLHGGRAPSTVRVELQLLAQAWRWGREVGLVSGEIPRVQVRGGPVRARYTPTRPEIARVLVQLDGWARLAVLLYAATGARLGEIATLTWGRVDLDAGVLVVHGKRGARDVPLVGPALESLRAAWEGHGRPVGEVRVLQAVAQATSYRLDDRLKVACRKAGVTYFPPGGLRRAAVVELYRAGVDPALAGAIVGHSPTVALMHYRSIAGEEKAQAVAKARLGALGVGEVIEGPWGANPSQLPAQPNGSR